MNESRIVDEHEHRPWPLPAGPWIMHQGWQDLLFAHWRVPVESLRRRVPAPLSLDLFDGDAWVGVIPFLMTGVHGRFLPRLPGLADFHELNCRTYVRYGNRPGVFFFSLDADSAPAVSGGRLFYRLSYHLADMKSSRRGDWVHYHSRRRDGKAEFVGRYRATGDVFEPKPGSIEHFLTERYALYSVLRNGRPLRAEIHHPMWRLQQAEAEIEQNTIAEASGVVLAEQPALLHFAEMQHALVWPPHLM